MGQTASAAPGGGPRAQGGGSAAHFAAQRVCSSEEAAALRKALVAFGVVEEPRALEGAGVGLTADEPTEPGASGEAAGRAAGTAGLPPFLWAVEWSGLEAYGFGPASDAISKAIGAGTEGGRLAALCRRCAGELELVVARGRAEETARRGGGGEGTAVGEGGGSDVWRVAGSNSVVAGTTQQMAAANAVFLCRTLLRGLVERVEPGELAAALETTTGERNIHTGVGGGWGTGSAPAPINKNAFRLVESLIGYIVWVRSRDAEQTVLAYVLGLECMRCLLTLFGTQLCTLPCAVSNTFLNVAMAAGMKTRAPESVAVSIAPGISSPIPDGGAGPSGDGDGDGGVQGEAPHTLLAVELVDALLDWYVKMPVLDPCVVTGPAGERVSVQISGGLPIAAGTPPPTASTSPLHDCAASLLMVLCYHRPIDFAPDSGGPEGRALEGYEYYAGNPFRAALGICVDRSQKKTSPSGGIAPKVSFRSLHDVISSTLIGAAPKGRASAGIQGFNDISLLLLYTMLKTNALFREHMIKRALKRESLLLPLLELVYKSTGLVDQVLGANQLYVLLAVILLLTENERYCSALFSHEAGAPLPDFALSWHAESKRLLLEGTSLSSLFLLVLCRAVKLSLGRQNGAEAASDLMYLRTTCLAALSNVSPVLRKVTPLASQRMVQLFEGLSVRWIHAVRALHAAGSSQPAETPAVRDVQSEREGDAGQGGDLSDSDLGGPASSGPRRERDANLEVQRAKVYTAACFSRMAGEVLCSSFRSEEMQAANIELVYAILQRLSVFEDVVTLVDTSGVASESGPHAEEAVELYAMAKRVVSMGNFVGLAVDRDAAAHGLDSQAAPAQVRAGVARALGKWSAQHPPTPAPPSRYEYEEEAEPENFFVPYAWGVSVARCGIPWDVSRVTLFAI